MIWNGRELAFRQLWEELGVSIPESDSGTFSSLLYCPHPEHANSRTPAFQANLVKPFCNCFGADCFGSSGKPGTIEYAVQAIRGCDEKEARRFIMRFTRVALGGRQIVSDGLRRRKSVESLTELRNDLERFQRGDYTYLPKQARAYLEQRGVDQQMRGSWQVGFDEEAERLVIPAFDERGNLRFLIRRAIDGRQPKYLYSPGSVKSDVLFGLLHLPKTQRMLVLVEGSLDVIHLGLGGIHAVGTLGSGLSEKQVKLVRERDPERVYLFFDRDAAGVQNVLDASEKLDRLPVFVCRYSAGDDPAELTAAQARRSIERAIPRHEFLKIVRRTTPSKTTKEAQVGNYHHV
jgi:DNA primase